jgi:hypothetical protein
VRLAKAGKIDLMVRSAATPRVSNHEAEASPRNLGASSFETPAARAPQDEERRLSGRV